MKSLQVIIEQLKAMQQDLQELNDSLITFDEIQVGDTITGYQVTDKWYAVTGICFVQMNDQDETCYFGHGYEKVLR